MKTTRWILVPVAGFAGWYLALLSGAALFRIGTAACPADQLVSGFCAAPWFGAYMSGVTFIGPSLAAILMIGGAASVAPSHRGIVALASLAIGAGLAAALVRQRLFIGPAALSVMVGGIFARWIWKREEIASKDRGAVAAATARTTGAFAALAGAALVFGISAIFFSNRFAIGPKFGRGPFTAKDLPWLTKAVETRDNTLDALSAIGRVGRDPAPAVPLLIKTLDDPNPEAVGFAISTLEHIGPAAKDASHRLRELALSPTPPYFNCTRDSMKALAGIGDFTGVIQAGQVDDSPHQDGLADAIRAYEVDGPGLSRRLRVLVKKGDSDYVRESAAMGLARIAPATPGLVAFFEPRLAKLSTDFDSVKDAGLRLYYGGQIKDIRRALSRINTKEANELLRKYPGG